MSSFSFTSTSFTSSNCQKLKSSSGHKCVVSSIRTSLELIVCVTVRSKRQVS